MTSGPPPTEAGPSKSASSQSWPAATNSVNGGWANASSRSTYTGSFQTYSNVDPYYAHIPPNQPQAYGPWKQENGQQSYAYYGGYPQAWNGNWPPGYSYPAVGSYVSSQPVAPPVVTDMTESTQAPALGTTEPFVKPDTPPPLPSKKHWDEIIISFLKSAGLIQALRGFEADMLLMNPEFELKTLPSAVEKLREDLEATNSECINQHSGDRPLEKRKLDYIHLANGVEPRSPTSVTKSISSFLAQNRARNDASNRQEFLLSLPEKRQRLNEDGDSTTPIPSCARTDAKTQNRDLQMKYDIAKNEDGPLRKTMKTSHEGSAPSLSKPRPATQDEAAAPTSERYPALDERVKNIETHAAVRYVPSPPLSLLDRLRFLEDHLVHLEKEYPPWAALHFNQPNRGWPPPPRPTPIIVPSHLTSTSTTASTDTAESLRPATPVAPEDSEPAASSTKQTKGKSGGRQKSSLHRAVMERLEVQKAMKDLASGESTHGDAGAE
ncbi:unnamed protein product [Somion occarium]|uniref:Uncharacterized protein n=1 Tax=Somion occarium TaxID=3059160 RepID=A0ABP1DEY8_9APHY